MLAVSPATVAAANPTQVSVIHFRVDRRVTPSMSRSGGAAGTCSACFSTVAIVSFLSLPKPRRAQQGRGVRFANRRPKDSSQTGAHEGPRHYPGAIIELGARGLAKCARATISLQGPPRRVSHAKVRITLRDPLNQRKALRVAQERQSLQSVDHRRLDLVGCQRLPREARAVDHR